MKAIEDHSRRRPRSWKIALVSACLALTHGSQGFTGFQTLSMVSPSTSIPIYASTMRSDDDKSTQQPAESRTWSNVQRPTRAARNNAKVGPILIDKLPTHDSDVPVPGRGRKKMKPMPVTGYDAQAILDFYDRRPLQVGWRLNSLGFPLLGWYLGLLSDKALGISENPYVMRKRGVELRQHLVRSQSVALIKVSTFCWDAPGGGSSKKVAFVF